MLTRRTLLKSAAATALLPAAVKAASHSAHTFGDITVSPVSHASFGLTTPAGTLLFDPVGDPSAFADIGPADTIFVTHEHGDHYNGETLTALAGSDANLVVNPKVMSMLPADLASRATALENGQSTDSGDIHIDAIPAYNTTPDRMRYHPEGRDNGYILHIGDMVIYVAGDTEDIPEMRALSNIDLAFLPMNLPYTMDVAAAASAVQAFRPANVYPYHYKGQSPEEFATLVGDASTVHFGDWY